MPDASRFAGHYSAEKPRFFPIPHMPGVHGVIFQFGTEKYEVDDPKMAALIIERLSNYLGYWVRSR